MSTATSYKTLISRATAAGSDDPTLSYDLTDRIQSEAPDGATRATQALQELLQASETHIRLRILKLIDTLVIECGIPFHEAMIQCGLLLTLANLQDRQVAIALPTHIASWKNEMGAAYDAAFQQAFSQVDNISSTSTTVARRGVAGLGQLRLRPVSPLYPFMTIPYLRAIRILEAARDMANFHLQAIHIARQALHLVILLNDAVDPNLGPTDEMEDERIDLEDQLMDLEEALDKWSKVQLGGQSVKADYLKHVEEIKEQYIQFYRSRFYYQNPRDPEKDKIYQKLVEYDKRSIYLQRTQLGLADDSEAEERRRQGDDDDDDGDDRSAYIESVHTSPAPPGREVPGVEPTEEPSRVTMHLASDQEAPPSSQVVEAEASTSAAATAPAGDGDALEAARRFRKQEEENDAPEQTFTCPVPGCGKTFAKQHLLKYHIREHDDRPYRCPMRGCDRRFATPNEQRVHEALHRIKNMGIVPNMPDFAPPIAHTAAPAPPPPEPAPVVATEPVEEEKKEGEKKDEGSREPSPPPVKDDKGKKKDGEVGDEGEEEAEPEPEPEPEPLSRPQDQEERQLAEAIERSLQDEEKRRQAEEMEAKAAAAIAETEAEAEADSQAKE